MARRRAHTSTTPVELRYAGTELAISRLQQELDSTLSQTWGGRLALRLARWYAAWKS
ncbi:hypothetical protein ACGFZP_05195 [Kitasatospora sp. NPDC048239]|uniref:hypothetical protein n=1 Tax=Kitasatospora sp. NPDC048239 TaxID=3364046 RepID=UPI003712A823